MSRWQFELMTRQDASALLAGERAPTADTYADHVAAWRRLRPVTTPEERAAAKAYAERAALERFQRILREEWPEHGPIIVRTAPEGG